MAVQAGVSSICSLSRSLPNSRIHRGSPKFRCRSGLGGDEDYLIDAPVSVGDGFSFSGGKYSDGPSRSDEWLAQGKMVKAHPVIGSKEKAKDPIFGLTMGAGSQSPADVFRWFCIEAGSSSNPSVILIHGFPSQVGVEEEMAEENTDLDNTKFVGVGNGEAHQVYKRKRRK